MSGIDLGNITENSIVSGKDGGRSLCNINYILYIAGFFLVIPALIGFVIALASQEKSDQPYQSHFKYQKNIFIVGLVYTFFISILTLISPLTFGITWIIALILGAIWFVWTILKIVRGMQALGRKENIS